MKLFRERMEALRKSKKLSGYAVYNLTGISASNLLAAEQGKRQRYFSEDMLRRLGPVYGVEPERFIIWKLLETLTPRELEILKEEL